MVLSILVYFVFALVYNGMCVDCYGLTVPYWVMQHTMGTLQFWVICLLSAFLAVLPRYFWIPVFVQAQERLILGHDSIASQLIEYILIPNKA